MKIYDSVVIGAGAAGMTAAIYLKRSNLDVLIIEKETPGGVMNLTATIDNYPGLPNVNGMELSNSMYQQIVDLGIEYRNTMAVEIEDKDGYKLIKTTDNEIKTKTIIIATGRIPRRLGLPNEDSLVGRGISWCAICDGFFFRGRNVAVVGGGNSAIEESLHLTSIVNQLHVINKNDNLKADKILQDRLLAHDNVKLYNNSQVVELIKEEDRLKAIKLNSGEEIQVDGIFLYIGFDPDVKCFIKNKIQLENGYIVVDKNMKTSIDGVYACGDVVKKDVYQITTATGDATIAATSVKEYLTR